MKKSKFNEGDEIVIKRKHWSGYVGYEGQILTVREVRVFPGFPGFPRFPRNDQIWLDCIRYNCLETEVEHASKLHKVMG